MRIVVTGASRGIGLELVRQLSKRDGLITATARTPESADELNALAASSGGHVEVRPCDVASDASVAAFASALADQPVDVLINNAGAPPMRDNVNTIEEGDRILERLNVNAVGALRMSRALLPNLRAGLGRKLLHIGSVLGSIRDVATGDTFGYRMSKAALHMAARALAHGLSAEKIASLVVHPGWVQTAMGGPRAPIPVAVSAAGIIARMDRLTLRQSGRFVDYRGRRLNW